MVSRSTHVYKTAGSLELKVDVYTKSPDQAAALSESNVTACLWLHGGGFVALNRQSVRPHVVQSCLRRGWVLVTADYRLFPQANGQDAVDDVKDAYYFVRNRLVEIVAGSTATIPNVILAGASAGKSFHTHH